MLFGLATRAYFKAQLENHLPSPTFNELFKGFDALFVICLCVTGSVLAVFSVIFARKLILPIRRMLSKTHSVLNPDLHPKQASSRESALDRFDEETLGEWSDLESSIEDIRKDIQAKIESMTVEREEQATLMSAISDAILAIDKDGAPLFYNSRFALLFEGGTLEKGKRLWDILRFPQILAAFQEALKEGKSASVEAFPLEQPRGKRYFSVSVSPLRKKDKVYGAVGIFHDVTDLKLAEQMRIDFVANVSHELRTPLTSIKGYTDTLMMDLADNRPASSEFLEIIGRNANRLMHLISDLLDLSSLESTEIIQKTVLSTEELTSRVLKQMAGAFDSKKQILTKQVSASTVMGDSRRIEQVLVNLLDNANKYTPESGKIRILWESQDGGVLLKIQDSGPGVPEEHQPRLFERFYRVDKARSREQGGTGLGLAIVKHIMQRHGGSVSVSSAPGQGSQFICTFPH